MATRPVATPELYNGEGPFDAWTDHFESVAKLNGWKSDDMAKWLAVRLVGRAQIAYKQLSEKTRENYENAKSALLRRFESESKRSLYAAEFQARCKLSTEDWATFADDLKTLADKAFPDLEAAAREKLAVDRFLGQISEPQPSFSVRQKQPATIDDAVAATQELQSHLQLANNRAQPPSEFPIGAVTDRDRSLQQIDRTATLLEQLVTRIEKLETELSTSQRPQPPQSNRRYNRDQQRRQGLPRQPRGPIVCFRCGQEGHFARGCASPPVTASQDQGN